jgi:hypothetical protein
LLAASIIRAMKIAILIGSKHLWNVGYPRDHMAQCSTRLLSSWAYSPLPDFGCNFYFLVIIPHFLTICFIFQIIFKLALEKSNAPFVCVST